MKLFSAARATYQMNIFSHAIGLDPISPMNVWEDFLDSEDYKNVIRYYSEACGPKIATLNKSKPSKKSSLPSKKCWANTLTQCIHLWQMVCECKRKGRAVSSDYNGNLVVLNKGCGNILSMPVWKTLVFLLKGIYYLENGVPLNNLQEEESSRFLLHATIGALPLCKSECNYNIGRDLFDHVLELCRDQVNDIGPVRSRLPIHAAASNKGRFYQETQDFYTDGRNYVNPQSLAGYMLCKILEVNPEAARIKDADGNTPIALASLNGHSHFYLEKLLQASPGAVGPSGVLLAMGTCHAVVVSKNSRFWIQRKAKDQDLYYKTQEGQEESLDCIYNLFRSDPAAVLNFLSNATI